MVSCASGCGHSVASLRCCRAARECPPKAMRHVVLRTRSQPRLDELSTGLYCCRVVPLSARATPAYMLCARAHVSALRHRELPIYPTTAISRPILFCCCLVPLSACQLHPKRCAIMSCALNRTHLAAGLGCRFAVRLSADQRRPKPTHHRVLRIQAWSSCGGPCCCRIEPIRTRERLPSATRQPELRLHCRRLPTAPCA
jgi:hypothetical protein